MKRRKATATEDAILKLKDCPSGKQNTTKQKPYMVTSQQRARNLKRKKK